MYILYMHIRKYTMYLKQFPISELNTVPISSYNRGFTVCVTYNFNDLFWKSTRRNIQKWPILKVQTIIILNLHNMGLHKILNSWEVRKFVFKFLKRFLSLPLTYVKIRIPMHFFANTSLDVCCAYVCAWIFLSYSFYFYKDTF